MLEFITMLIVMSVAFLGASITVALILGGIMKAGRSLRTDKVSETA
ncbi:MAG: hypothetical protein JSV26_05420 [bacterium]|nr:MAG: hypothetical protein JSV26_05420 [bacterium]